MPVESNVKFTITCNATTDVLQLNKQVQAIVTLTLERTGKVIHFSLGNSLLQLFKYEKLLFLNVSEKKWELA